MTPPQGRELGEWPGCPRRTDRAGVFSRPFQLSSATQELGQEGLASAWALAPRAVTATNLGQQMSKPKVSVAASSRSRLPKPPATAVQPKRRPPDEGQKAAEAIHLLSSPGPLPKSGDAVPVTTIPVPSPLPIVLSRAMLLCREVQSWCSVTSSFTTFHWVTAPNAEITRVARMLPCSQMAAPLSPCALLGPSPRGSFCPLVGVVPSSLLHPQ